MPDPDAGLEDLVDEREDDSATEYEDALSSFSEDDVLQTEEGCSHDMPRVRKRSVAGSPVASTNDGAPRKGVEGFRKGGNDRRPWISDVKPKEHHRLARGDVASMVIEEEPEEDETDYFLLDQHAAGHSPLDPMARSKSQRPSREPRSSWSTELPRRHQRHPSYPEANSNSSLPFLNVPPRKIHHPRPRYQSPPFSPQSRTKSSSGQRPQQHGISSTSRRSSSTFEGAEAVEVTGGSFVAASTSSIVNNTYNYHYNTTTNHLCSHGSPSQPCCRRCQNRRSL